MSPSPYRNKIGEYIKFDTEQAYRLSLAKENPYLKKLYKTEPEYVDTDTVMSSSIMHTIRTRIDENLEHAIMSTVQTIGGTTYQDITVDKKQILDMLKKAKATKVRTSEYNFYADDKKRTDHHYYCPNCMKQLRTVKTVDGFKHPVDISGPIVNFCPHCGQKLDWEEETENEHPRAYTGPKAKSWKEASDIAFQMKLMIEEYGVVTVADAKELAGGNASYGDDKYGWCNLKDVKDAKVTKEHDGWRVMMPKPHPIG